jgi:hypothetical protein
MRRVLFKLSLPLKENQGRERNGLVYSLGRSGAM